jgi:S-adenosylmethionine-diacylglycerol 3-amino-3-carboxypropyl transferase
MITSAGCNAIEYLLDDPHEIHCIDLNFRQNALLEFKKALFLHTDYETVDQWFGKGHHPEALKIYSHIRPHLPNYCKVYWDKKISYFKQNKIFKSFYYKGASGLAAWLMKTTMLEVRKEIRYKIYDLLETKNIEEQKELYAEVEYKLWNRITNYLTKHPLLMTMVGVPAAQIHLINRDIQGGLYGFIKNCLKTIFSELPLYDNYFWRVYIHGEYSEQCRPEYLKAHNFEKIRTRFHRIKTFTTSFDDHLLQAKQPFSHFVLLDHQDWLAYHRPDLLESEWHSIKKSSAEGAKVIMRSAGLNINFAKSFTNHYNWFPELTKPLHSQDRVGTYGSLHLAQIKS